ncbi:monocyte to macrophage differentiation protein [Paragonimus westermani]|uniref:Monocyte to macrophage differentiation protein n=1 Tax=Paragonimus westermani TaxID=34504 RepID=A0A5J4NEZ7_9TREM|nr:monocyte to macrophage differentiation protein [Paragonimus westermani]
MEQLPLLFHESPLSCSLSGYPFLYSILSTRWKNTPAPSGQPYYPTTVEQVANCATHVPWVPISVYGLFRLYSKATNLVEVSAAIVYGLAIVFLFFTSSAFHVSSLLARHSRIRSFLHLCDRVVIYLFIASSYTPWLVLRNFHALWGWFTLFIVWLASVSGIVFQCLYHEQ